VDLLARLERALEQAFEGLFSSKFRGRIQPVEIARRLSRTLEDHKMVSVSRVFVPNEFSVSLHPDDYQTLAPFEPAIVPELARHVDEAARQSHYGLLGTPVVTLHEDGAVERGGIKIDAKFVRREDQARRQPDNPTTDLGRPAATNHAPGRYAALNVIEGPDNGVEFVLTGEPMTIGRGAGNAIALTDSSVSRSHARIALEPDGFHLQDLGSKNGSFVQGLRAKDVLLNDGDNVAIGATLFRFRAARVV
jgi:hypothetical protein